MADLMASKKIPLYYTQTRTDVLFPVVHPAPQAGEWNQAYFEELVANSAPTTTNPTSPTALPSQDGENISCQRKVFPFTCVRCKDKKVTDFTVYAPVRWADALADDAVKTHHDWYTALLNLNGYSLERLGPSGTYVRSLAWRFKTKEEAGLLWICALSDGSCDETVSCSETDNPATSMMLTSWANIRTFHHNQYKTVSTIIQETSVVDFGLY